MERETRRTQEKGKSGIQEGIISSNKEIVEVIMLRKDCSSLALERFAGASTQVTEEELALLGSRCW